MQRPRVLEEKHRRVVAENSQQRFPNSCMRQSRADRRTVLAYVFGPLCDPRSQYTAR